MTRLEGVNMVYNSSGDRLHVKSLHCRLHYTFEYVYTANEGAIVVQTGIPLNLTSTESNRSEDVAARATAKANHQSTSHRGPGGNTQVASLC